MPVSRPLSTHNAALFCHRAPLGCRLSSCSFSRTQPTYLKVARANEYVQRRPSTVYHHSSRVHAQGGLGFVVGVDDRYYRATDSIKMVPMRDFWVPLLTPYMYRMYAHNNAYV